MSRPLPYSHRDGCARSHLCGGKDMVQPFLITMQMMRHDHPYPYISGIDKVIRGTGMPCPRILPGNAAGRAGIASGGVVSGRISFHSACQCPVNGAIRHGPPAGDRYYPGGNFGHILSIYALLIRPCALRRVLAGHAIWLSKYFSICHISVSSSRALPISRSPAARCPET